jgi:hypothetical protein
LLTVRGWLTTGSYPGTHVTSWVLRTDPMRNMGTMAPIIACPKS